MLLELALGGELFSLLQKKAPLPDKEAMFYVSQVVAIFAFMYSQKVRPLPWPVVSSTPLGVLSRPQAGDFHYSLLSTHYSLLTTHYSLLATHYSLLTTS